MDEALVTTILSRLSPTSLERLTFNRPVIVPADKEYNDLLAKDGWDPVPYAEGFYYAVKSVVGWEDMLVNALNSGVRPHVAAVINRFDLSIEELLSSIVLTKIDETDDETLEMYKRIISVINDGRIMVSSHPILFEAMCHSDSKHFWHLAFEDIAVERIGRIIPVLGKLKVKPNFIAEDKVLHWAGSLLWYTPYVVSSPQRFFSTLMKAEPRNVLPWYDKLYERADSGDNEDVGSWLCAAFCLDREEDIVAFFRRHPYRDEYAKYFTKGKSYANMDRLKQALAGLTINIV